MIKHIVMFRFLESANGKTRLENARIAKEMLENLQGKIDTLVSSKVTLSCENVPEGNYDLVLEADYNDMDGLNKYIVHPLHRKVGEFLKEVREARACVDYEY